MALAVRENGRFGDQLPVLRGMLARCLSGEGGIVLVEGAAGCGKTHALDTLTDLGMRSGASVLKLRGASAEAGIPLATLRQLLECPELPRATADRVRRALDRGADHATPPTARPRPAEPAEMPTGWHIQGAREFRVALFELAARVPVVICVDELEFVDAASLQYLLHLAGRSDSVRLLLVLARTPGSEHKEAVFTTELLRQPHFRRIRLRRMTREDTDRLVRTALKPPPGTPVAPAWYDISGGNPLLLRALTDDHRTTCAPDAQPGGIEPVVGDMFAQAVLACVYRSGRAAAQVAEGMAVLGASATADLLGRLLGLAPAGIARAVSALRQAGLAEGHAFRHPHLESTVLEDINPDRRSRMHRRAAALLHQSGEHPLSAARHLLAAHACDEPWAVPVLRAAAEQALADDDAKLAMTCLEAAYAACADPDLRAGIGLGLASIMWRLNPSASERLLEEPLAAYRANRLPAAHIEQLLKLLLAHGRVEEAKSLLGGIGAATPGAAQPSALAQLRTAGELAHGDPPRPGPGTRTDRVPRQRTSSAPAASPLATASAALSGFFDADHQAEDPPVAAAERALAVSPLTDATFETIVNSLNALAQANRPDKAAPWCDSFMEEARRREYPGWQAVFASLRADIALRQGNLRDTEKYAGLALDCVPGDEGSIFLGGPLASRILAYTAMGRHRQAARELSRPVSEKLFQSVYGLGYSRARGRFYLATNRLNAALGEFLTVGRLAEQWELDQPSLLPWRTEAAEAWLRLGERERAQELILDELARSGPGDSRVRGTALRLKAAAGEPDKRPRLLAEAVEELQCSGDRLELARTLGYLGRTYLALGDRERGRSVSSRAWQMAKECGAEKLCLSIRMVVGDPKWGAPAPARVVTAQAPGPLELKRAGDTPGDSKLSESEARVAALAVDGYTNREIAANLYITVSTVEQHLTRVYRKLRIRSRQELPLAMRTKVDEIA
ncbi:AAA family ATPase [Streptomyces sp. NPDC053367]|uniref:helix-turn-helix transcriptional regulator n=1 Tax=Streptomyces sp. NPDC053367 TaxID=3365700 RepID=UPI0037D329FD